MSPIFIFVCSVIGLTSGAGVLPDSVTAAAGDSVTFTTSLAPSETPFVSLLLTFKGVPIVTPDYTDLKYKGRITLFTSTGSLELRDLALSDAGVYSVSIVTAGGGALNTGSTTLNIYERVSNVSVTASSTDLVEFNDTVSLSCSASGSALSFVWFNGSAEVKPSDRVRFTNGGATVTFNPVLRYDHGSYSCKVSDPVSSSTSDPLQLSVSYGPDSVVLKNSPSGEHHKKGSNVWMNCSTDSRPPAQFRWFLDELKLYYTDAEVLLRYLVVSHSGNYSCEAFNNKTLRDMRSQPAPISVWDDIKNPSIQASTVQEEGSSLNLTCDASNSILSREWTINGIEIKPSGNIEFYDDKRVLSFRNLTRKDDGIYSCNISNPFSSVSAEYTMKAIYGPENVRVSGPVELVEGGTLILSCSADSGPTPLYIWTKNGTYLVQSDQYVKNKIRVSDSGEYICQVTNEITMKTSQGSIKVLIAPKNTLSAGAIAGITVATLVVVAGVAAGGFYWYKHK